MNDSVCSKRRSGAKNCCPPGPELVLPPRGKKSWPSLIGIVGASTIGLKEREGTCLKWAKRRHQRRSFGSLKERYIIRGREEEAPGGVVIEAERGGEAGGNPGRRGMEEEEEEGGGGARERTEGRGGREDQEEEEEVVQQQEQEEEEEEVVVVEGGQQRMVAAKGREEWAEARLMMQEMLAILLRLLRRCQQPDLDSFSVRSSLMHQTAPATRARGEQRSAYQAPSRCSQRGGSTEARLMLQRP